MAAVLHYGHIWHRIFCFMPVLCVFTGLFYPGRLSAQSHEFKNIGPGEGLSQVTVNAIFQDAAGYLWFGTQDGLNRYDGYEFIHFKSEPGNENSLSHSWIWDIFEDADRNLWVATWTGLNKISPDRTTFTRYLPDPETNGTIRGERPVSIAGTRNGDLWVGTWGGGLNLYDPEEDTFSAFSSAIDSTRDLPGDQVRRLWLDSEQRLWIGTWSGLWTAEEGSDGRWSFHRYNLGGPEKVNRSSRMGNADETTHSDQKSSSDQSSGSDQDSGSDQNSGSDQDSGSISESNFKITSFIEDHQGNIWCGTLGNGLFRMKGNIGETVHISRLTTDGALPSDQVTSLSVDAAGRIWVGTFSSGVCIIDYLEGEYRSVTMDPMKEHSLGSNSIHSIYRDRSGLVWLGTDGLSMYNPALKKFYSTGNLSSVHRDLESITRVSALFEDAQTRIWAGSDEHGLFLLADTRTGKDMAWLRSVLAQLESINVSAVAQDQTGRIWVGTRGNGLVSIDPESKEFNNIIEFPGITGMQGINYINGLVFIPPSSLWIATYEQGLIRFDTEARDYKRYANDPANPESFPANYLLRVYADSQHRLWICTWGAGIIHFDPRSETWQGYTSIPGDTTSISDNIVHTFIETRRGNRAFAWVGTRKGLSCLEPDREESHVTNYYQSDGLPGNIVNAIVEDNNGSLWISTNSGLCRFNPDSGSFRNYDMHDGLQGNEFNAGAGIRLHDGRLIFGGVDGFNIFYPDSISGSHYDPPVVITRMRLFEEELWMNPELKLVRLDYLENFLSFEFSALDFSQPLKIRYRYKMEGVDRDWVFAGDRRFASYTDLSPGSYTFTVNGTNADGIWSDKYAEISLVIAPPYWQSWWFRTIMTGVVLVLIYTGYAYRMRRVREIEKLRVRIASDLHDDIGSSLTHINVHTQQIRQHIEHPDIRKSLDRIGDLSREVISTMSDIVWSIDARNDSTGDLISRMRDYAFNTLVDHEISVDFKVKGFEKSKKMNIAARQNIFSIFKEAVSNILKHAQATEVYIQADNTGNQFLMRISDNGAGFDPASVKRGNGLGNMQMRAMRMGGRLSIFSNDGTSLNSENGARNYTSWQSPGKTLNNRDGQGHRFADCGTTIELIMKPL